MAVQQAAGIRVIGFPNDLVERTLSTMPGLVKSKIPKGLYGVVDQDLGSPGFLQQLIVDAGPPTSRSTASPSSGGRRSRHARIAPGLDQADVRWRWSMPPSPSIPVR